MRHVVKVLAIVGLFLIATILLPANVHAQAATDFSFQTFGGTYYLDRNAQGVATLTTQEDMVVIFPSNSNLYGIKRSLPTSYDGHNLNLKIISVTDDIGNLVNYKTYNNGQGNEIVQTGDPDISLSGLQTYRIKYQTSGVVAISQKKDEFLIDVNGRGWQQTFGSVKAFINMAKGFAADLAGQPSCYIGFGNQELNGCTVQYQNKSDGLLVTSAAGELSAHQALIVKLEFKQGTFNQIRLNTTPKLLTILGVTVVLAAGFTLASRKQFKR